MRDVFLESLKEEELPQDARARILLACRQEGRARSGNLRRVWIAALAAALMLGTLCVTLGATQGWFHPADRTVTHFGTQADAEVVIPQPEASASVTQADGSTLALICNAVTGGGDRVYFDLTLARADAQPIVAPVAGMTLEHIFFPDATVVFADGLSKKLYVNVLQDSTPDRLHLEGSILLRTAELTHIGERATLQLGAADLWLIDGEGQQVIERLSGSTPAVPLTVTFCDTCREGEIPPILLQRDGVTLCFTSVRLTGASLTLQGTCSEAEASMPWLADILGSAAVTLSDGTTVLCGDKIGAGTQSDGVFVLEWLLATTLDPAKAVTLTLDGQTVPLP